MSTCHGFVFTNAYYSMRYIRAFAGLDAREHGNARSITGSHGHFGGSW
jgi:hypothetical protein